MTRWSRRRNSSALSVVWKVALAILVFVVWLVAMKWPQWFTSTKGLDANQRAEELGRVRTALLASIVGLIGVIGAYYTVKTFRLNLQGQITERFTRAVDQLGSPELDVRLGGIYALERLARDSLQDHGPIIEILTAYVRERTPLPTRDDATAEGPDQPVQPPASTGYVQDDAGPSADVQAVLTVLGRRKVAHDAVTLVVWLQQTALGGALFTGHWKSAVLVEANLQRARMSWANLDGAALLGANLKGAMLMGASLKGALLDSANLEDALLHGANLEGARLGQVPGMEDVKLSGASYDAETRWPDGFDYATSGAVLQPTMYSDEAVAAGGGGGWEQLRRPTS